MHKRRALVVLDEDDHGIKLPDEDWKMGVPYTIMVVQVGSAHLPERCEHRVSGYDAIMSQDELERCIDHYRSERE